MRLYLDANAIIFAVEGPEALREEVLLWIGRAETANGTIITSRISHSECFARPFRLREPKRIGPMQEFFAGQIEIVDIDNALTDDAARLHYDFSFKTIDAIHVASAIRAKANYFLTRDTDINRYPNIRGIQIIALPRQL